MVLLIGKKVPDFSLKAVVNKKIQESFTFSSLQDKIVVLFFYPLNFTFVCPTELHAFQEKIGEFEKRGAVVVGCSIDSCHSHLAWLKTPRMQGGIEGITYPLLSDINKKMSKEFDVLNEEEGIAYRALFIIDRKGIVRHQMVNDFFLGRSVEEVLRIIDALIFHEEHGDVCPANWKQGHKSLSATLEGVIGYFQSVSLP